MGNFRRIALYAMLSFGGIGGLIIARQSFSEHPGLIGFAFTSAWLFPMVIGCWLAWRRPMIAFPLLMIWAMSILGLLVWQALSPSWWITVIDSNGPIITAAIFALAPPLAIYGYDRRTRYIGLLLIGLPLLNMLATSNTDSSGNTNLLITLPVLATGVLYLVASFVDKRDDSAKEK
jgi:hypothetical protein